MHGIGSGVACRRTHAPAGAKAAGRFTPLKAAAFIVGLLLGPVSAPAPAEVTPGETPRIDHGARPPEETVTWRLEERWRIGGDEEEVIIGSVRDAAVDQAGNLYLLDGRLAQVLVYSPEGELLRTLGREGEGPGEFRMPLDLELFPDGRIGVCQPMPGKIVFLDRAGNPAGSLEAGGSDPTAGGIGFFDEIQARGDHLVVAGRQLKRSGQGFDRRRYLAALDPQGQESVRFLDESAPDRIVSGRYVEREEYFVTDGGWAMGPDGRVYAAPERDRYAIHVYEPDGTPARVVTREFRPWKRTAEEKGRVGEGLLVMVNGRRVEIEAEAEDHDPCIVGMHVAPDGELWVLNSRSTRDQPEGIFQTYDVFASDGRFVRQVALACPGDPQQDRLFPLDGRRMLLVPNAREADRLGPGRDAAEAADEEPASLQVICYEVAGTGPGD